MDSKWKPPRLQVSLHCSCQTLPAPLPCACRSVRTPEITAEREAGGETAADELACMRTCVFEVRTSARICSIPSPPPWLDSDAPPAAATALFLSLLRLSQFIDAAVPPQHGGTAAQLLKLLPALLCCCAGAVLPRRLLAIDAAALPLRRDPLRVIPARVIMGDPSRFSPARVSVGAVRIVCRNTDGSRALSSTPEVARQPAAATALFLSLLRLSQFIDAAVPPQHGGAAAQLLKLLPALLCCCAGAVLPRRMLATGAAALPRRRDPSRVIPARVIMKDPSRVSPARVGVGAVRIVRHTTDGSRALSSTPEAARQPAPLTPPRASGRSRPAGAGHCAGKTYRWT